MLLPPVSPSSARAAEVDPEDFQLQNRVGQLLFRLERYRDAVVCFRAALAADNKDTGLLFNLGEWHAAAGCKVGAVLTQNRAQVLRWSAAAGHTARKRLSATSKHLRLTRVSRAYRASQLHVRARRRLISPRCNRHVQRRLGMAFQKLGKTMQMRRYFQMVLGVNPTDYEANLAMGACFLTQVGGRFACDGGAL